MSETKKQYENPYNLKRFDADSMASTRAHWNTQARKHSKEVIAAEFDRILDWAQGQIDYTNPGCNTFAYGIFKDGAVHAAAIVEVVYLKEGKKWLKMLNLHLSPTGDVNFYEDKVDLSENFAIFAAAIVGTWRLTGKTHPARVTKLYARSGTLLSFFKGLGAHIEQIGGLKALHTTIEGRWLVFRAK